MTVPFNLTATFDTLELGQSSVLTAGDFTAWEEAITERLEALPGYIRHDTGHANYVQIDLETDDPHLAAIQCKTLSRQIERAYKEASQI